MDIQVTPLLKDSILLLSAKRKMLHDMREQLTTLVVGSSHGDYGFDPQYSRGSFNLCCRSQDLKHTLHLYQHVTQVAPNLQTLVLFYSVFSPGNFMEKSPGEKEICPAINELFHLGLDYEDPQLRELSENIKGRLDDFTVDIDGRAGFFPVIGKGFFPQSYGVTQRADDHLKLNRKEDANVFLLNTLLHAKASNHNVVIVIPPVRQDYKLACGGDFEILFKDLLLILEMMKTLSPDLAINLINAFDDDEFKDEFFGDFDHLLPEGEGTKRLSMKIDSHINLI